MAVSVFALFAAALSAVGVVVFGSGARLDRRVRRAGFIRLMTAVAAIPLIPANVALAMFGTGGSAGHASASVDLDILRCSTASASVAALCVITATVGAWWIDRLATAHPRRILAIGAHPDDLELACGGTLAKFHDSGHEVRALVMSSGELGGDCLARQQEAARGATFIGAVSVSVLEFPDTRLAEREMEMGQEIEAAIRRYNPDVIMTHSANDQHQDHHAVYRATLRAARNHPTILSYESPSVTRDFQPSLYVDIDDYVDVKIAAIRTHRDQAGKPYMTPERVRGSAVFRGAQGKVAHAEAFEPVRVLGSALGNL